MEQYPPFEVDYSVFIVRVINVGPNTNSVEKIIDLRRAGVNIGKVELTQVGGSTLIDETLFQCE